MGFVGGGEGKKWKKPATDLGGINQQEKGKGKPLKKGSWWLRGVKSQVGRKIESEIGGFWEELIERGDRKASKGKGEVPKTSV